MKSKKAIINNSDFWDEFYSDKCLPKEKRLKLNDIFYLELIDSTDEVAFFFKIMCNENKGKKNQRKFEFFQIMTVAEFEATDSSEIGYKLDLEY